MKKALITGITGQDGYFLSKLLIDKGYEVHGVVRRNSQRSHGTLDLLPPEYKDAIILHYGDVTDYNFISSLIKNLKPDEVYHLAAQSFVPYSYENPASTYDINIGGTLNVVNAIKDFSPDTRMYNAGSSEMFGQPKQVPQNEQTPFYPRSPYAVSKVAAFWTVKVYRDAYSLFMCNGISFNHESEIRGPEFVTRKIAIAVAEIANGINEELVLGNLNARKDWGYAGDFVEGFWRMLQHERPDDYVLATGELHTVREFVEKAFKIVGIDIIWEGEGLNEVGRDEKGRRLVSVSPKFFRPLEAENMVGDYSKAKKVLGWEPKIKFDQLVEIMVKSELQKYKKDGKPKVQSQYKG